MTDEQAAQDRAPTFEAELDRFLTHVNSLRSMVPMLGLVINALAQSSRNKLDKFAEHNEVETRTEDDRVTYRILPDHFREFDKLHQRYELAMTANRVVPPTFVVALVSQYDAFLGGVIRVLFHHRPDLLRQADRSLSYSDLLEMPSIGDARDYIVEREVESVLRKSHADHFTWLENKLAIPLRKGLDIWPMFIELTERRNLFVHTNGHVSSQYLRVCRKNGVDLDAELESGDILQVSSEYFIKSCDCITEIAIKLTHVMWRVLDSDTGANADDSLNQVCHDLMADRRDHLALTLLEFATETVKTHSSEQIELYLMINKAQAHKWVGDQNRCDEILSGIDWSAKGLQYKLARTVLQDDFALAADLMRQIGPDGDVGRNAYGDWALFREFRDSDIFQETYEEVFGEEFKVEEPQTTAESTGPAVDTTDDVEADPRDALGEAGELPAENADGGDART